MAGVEDLSQISRGVRQIPEGSLVFSAATSTDNSFSKDELKVCIILFWVSGWIIVLLEFFIPGCQDCILQSTLDASETEPF